jgi:signal transduction histidine kinase
MERTAEKARLEGEVAAASEAERRRISQDLHDGLCQQLTGARMQLAVLQGMEPGDDRLEELKRLSALLEASSDQAYDLSHGLWTEPPRPEETVEAITDLARRTSRPGGAVVAFQPRLACATCRNQRVTSLYGIAREAIANALKHARPGRIQVELDCLSGCGPTLTVQDDGQGQGPANPGRGLGLRMMAHAAREADGQLRIERGPGGGVRVVCSVPCASRETPA